MVKVRDLLYRQSNFKSAVYAGSGGLDRNVRTVSVVDAPDSVSFLSGGEVILTTGYLFKDDPMDMYHFVEGLIRGESAGLAIQMDIYLYEIPGIVADLATKHNFPIFSIPNDIGWSNIITRFHDLRIGAKHKQNLINVDAVTFRNMIDSEKCSGKKLREKFISLIGCAAVILSEDGKVCAVNHAEGWEALLRYVKSLRGSVSNFPFGPTRLDQYWVVSELLNDGKYIILLSTDGPIENNNIQLIQTYYNFTNLQNHLEQSRMEQYEQLIGAVVDDLKSEKINTLARGLEFYGYQYYCIAVVCGKEPDRVCRIFNNNIKSNSGFVESELHYILTQDKHEAVALLSICSGNMNRLEAAACLYRIRMMISAKSLKSRIYLGNICRSADEIKQSYRQANRARKMAEQLSCEAPVVFYSDLDAFDLLSGTDLNFDALHLLEKSMIQKSFDSLEECLKYGLEGFASSAQAAFSKLGAITHIDFSYPVNQLNMMLKLQLLKMRLPHREDPGEEAQVDVF